VTGRWWGTDMRARRHSAGRRGSTGFETNSEFKCFKQISNYLKLWSIRKVLSRAWKIEIKYDFGDLGEINNFLYRNFLRFRMDLQ
jgi:hypothetical protein